MELVSLENLKKKKGIQKGGKGRKAKKQATDLAHQTACRCAQQHRNGRFWSQLAARGRKVRAARSSDQGAPGAAFIILVLSKGCRL